MTSTVEQAREVDKISQQIYNLIAGRAAVVQGAVCADLLARWLAGHIVPGDEQKTKAVRERILKTHIEIVRRLIPINEEQILAQHG